MKPLKNLTNIFLNRKEKEGYKISLVTKPDDNKKFLNHLKFKFREENKEIKKGSYPLLKLDLDDLNYIKSKYYIGYDGILKIFLITS